MWNSLPNDRRKVENYKEFRRLLQISKSRNKTSLLTRFSSDGTETASPEQTRPVPVLIVSYMRSGSTFTADVINSYESSYYIFEPLRNVIKKMEKGSPIELINGTVVSEFKHLAVWIADFLFSWLTCDYDQLDKESVINIAYNIPTSFQNCLRKFKRIKKDSFLNTCIQLLQMQCESSKLRLVKTIRAHMKTTVEILLKRIPGLKVVHLFRDQRPRLLSAENTPTMMNQPLQQTAKLECSRIYENIAMHKVLKQQYPGQVETLLYERLAEHPISTAKRIYKFLNLPITKESITHIQNMTSAPHESKCNFCTKKMNSTKTAHAWRKKMSSDFAKIKMIESECENVQNVLGYMPVKNSEELINTSKILREVTPFTADTL
ncbi:carbohydrate sulfotransferase 5-like [Ylistrum balloti]|uniref:carbohydrate sulfotransferase 5-like n=1 Tax=Ylistrum balloti TaxID=509963 RepID=UPI002905AC65|nr:carbohydrate sulfotransferase 5-like [Ylistrum balloti]